MTDHALVAFFEVRPATLCMSVVPQILRALQLGGEGLEGKLG